MTKYRQVTDLSKNRVLSTLHIVKLSYPWPWWCFDRISSVKNYRRFTLGNSTVKFSP